MEILRRSNRDLGVLIMYSDREPSLTSLAVNIFIECGHVKPCLKVLKTCQRTVTCDFELRVSNVSPDDVIISFSCNC